MNYYVIAILVLFLMSNLILLEYELAKIKKVTKDEDKAVFRLFIAVMISAGFIIWVIDWAATIFKFLWDRFKTTNLGVLLSFYVLRKYRKLKKDDLDFLNKQMQSVRFRSAFQKRITYKIVDKINKSNNYQPSKQ